MTTERIEVQIADRVAPTIIHKIEMMERAAIRTESRITALQKSLNGMGSGGKGVAGIQQMVSAENQLARAIDRTAQAQQRSQVAEIRRQQQFMRTQSQLARQRGGGGGGGLGGGGRGYLGIGFNAAGGGGLGIGAAVNVGSMAGPVGMGVAAGGYIAKEAIGTVLEYSDAYRQLQNRVQNATGSLATTGPVIDRLRQIANDTAAPIQAVTEGWVRFDRVLQANGKTQEDSIRFTETLQTMLYRYGRTGAEAASATLQLTQAMGKGKLDGDEFRSVMENLPELGREIAKTMGLTGAELFKASRNGKITADVIYQAMENARVTVDKLPEPLTTVDMSFTRLKNNATQFFGELAAGQAVVSAFTGAIDLLSAALEKSDKGIDNIGKRVEEAKKGNAEALRLAQEEAQRRNDIASGKEREDRYRKMEEDKRAFLAGNKTIQQITQEASYEGMSEKEKHIAKGLAPIREAAAQKGITLNESDLADQRKALEATFKPRKERTNRDEENRERFMARVNAQLNNEIQLFGVLAPIRERQAKFNEIEERALGRKIKLTDDEAQSIKDRLKIIQDQVPIQQAMNDAYEEAVSPMRDYNAAMEANRMLVVQGAISDEQYIRNINRAKEALANNLNPMREANIAMRESFQIARLNNREGEIQLQINERLTMLRQQGLPVVKEEIDAYRQQLIELRKLNEEKALREELIEGPGNRAREFRQRAGILGEAKNQGLPYNTEVMKTTGEHGVFSANWYAAQVEARKEFYMQIEELRRKDLISEQDAEKAKMSFAVQQMSERMQKYRSVASAFEGLQRSHVSEIATVGKAAAIAGATMDTYVAANKALAELGPIAGPIAAVGIVASGMVNVSNIAAQPTGFKDGGYTGNGGVNDVAGVVHGREYVFDARTTARIGRENLDAMRAGAPVGSAGNGAPGAGTMLNLTLIMVGSEKDAQAVAAGAGGDAIVLGAIGRNPKQVRRILQGA